jgi:hypothetical protein
MKVVKPPPDDKPVVYCPVCHHTLPITWHHAECPHCTKRRQVVRRPGDPCIPEPPWAELPPYLECVDCRRGWKDKSGICLPCWERYRVEHHGEDQGSTFRMQEPQQ